MLISNKHLCRLVKQTEVLKISKHVDLISSSTQDIYSNNHGGRVANALACNARVDGFAPHLRRYFRDLFLESIVSSTEGHEMVRVALRELPVPCNVSGDN